MSLLPTGIPEAKVADALRRGGRLDTSETGSGLGLAIVSEIAHAYGGRLTFRKNEHAFEVRLHLPQLGAQTGPAASPD
ncbi:MAG TPA: GHKL domain-containing protein [Hyphomicrobium sp.]|nr:GHKL domain-containing protein [Hyphomicrobium sp.]